METTEEKLENEYIGKEVITRDGKITVERIDCSMFLIWHSCKLVGVTEDERLVEAYDVIRSDKELSDDNER